MTISRDKLPSGSDVSLDLSYLRFAKEVGLDIRKLLKDDRSFQRLTLAHSALTDDQFDIIAKSLIERDLEILVLDLDFNLLTPKSLDNLKALIEKRLVVHLCLYCNDKLVQDSTCQRELSRLAHEKDIAIYNLNPLIRVEKYPRIFALIQTTTDAKERDEMKDLASTTSKDQSCKQEESKDHSGISTKPGLSR
jgi:hypothetical protein